MYSVERTRRTQHSAESLWEALAAFNEIYTWHPLVKTSPGTARKEFAVGAARVCHFHDGTSVNERVNSIDPGRSMVIELSEFSMPLKEASAHLSITNGKGGAAVTFRMDFEPKFGLLGALMAKTVMKPKLGRMIDKILEALDQHLYAKAVAA